MRIILQVIKMSKAIKKIIIILVIVLIGLYLYYSMNIARMDYQMRIDSDNSSGAEEYLSLELSVTVFKLPLNYAIISGHMTIDDQELTLGSSEQRKRQVMKIDDQHGAFIEYYDPERVYLIDNVIEQRIDGGDISLTGQSDDMTFLYGYVLVNRRNIHTSISESFVLSGELIRIP